MTAITVTAELFVDGAWLDITRLDDQTKLLTVNGGQGGTIVRGRNDDGDEATPTTVSFQYQDDNATLDGDNPLSPYFRKIGLSTPLRLKVDGTVRASVELASLIPDWQDGTNTVTVDVEAATLARRLSGFDGGQKPLRATLERAMLAANPVLFWPMNDQETADRFASGIAGGAPLLFASEIEAGAIEGPAGTFGSFPNFADTPEVLSYASGRFSPVFSGNDWGVECIVFIEPSTDGDGTGDNPVFSWSTSDYTWGILTGWDPTDGAYVSVFGRIDGSNADVIRLADIPDGWAHVRLVVYQSGADVRVELYVNGTSVDSGGLGSRTVAGVTVNPPTGFVQVGSTSAQAFTNDSTGDYTTNTASVGMVGFFDYADATDRYDAFGGYDGETAGDRMARLAAEEGVSLTIQGVQADTVELGPQSNTGDETLYGEIKAAAATDLGILADSRTANELLYRTRVSLYNQPAAATLGYAHLSRGFRPAADDLRRANDVTADRSGGSSARYVIPDGDYFHWSTEQPPDGAGIRDRQDGVNSIDSLLMVQAAWRAHIASWREKRFKSVKVELARDAFSAADITALLALDVGDLLVINTDGAPPWVPYDEVRLIVQGYTEFVNQNLHTITFNTTPADVYEVAQLDSGPSSVLAAPIDDNDTSLKIAPGDGKPWSESANDLPYHIQVDGDPMTVTAISTDTAAFIAAGAVSYADNASVTPALPAGMTVDVGQLLVAVIFRRASGAGIIGANPAGWTTIAEAAAGDWKVAGRYYRTGDAAVQWTFSGGSAGDTTGGVVLGFSGLSMVLDKNFPAGYGAGYVTSINGSAQNIAYPAYLNRRTNSGMLIIGKKDDDWTSVATIAGTSELVDSSSTTGSDIGIVVDFYNPGTPTTVTAQSFTVTGGASAVSEGTVIGLRPLQTATVTRGIAGVATSGAVDAEIHGWRMGVNAL